MSLIQNITIKDPKTLFGGIQIAERTPIIELKSNYGLSKLRDVVVEVESGTVTNANGEYKVATGATASSTARLESAERGRYAPGSQGQVGIGVRVPVLPTGNHSGIWGYFDSANGFGFGADATGNFVFVRRNSVDTKVYQTNWNVDKLDGTGASKSTLDLTDGNIFQIDFSWYGYGTIEFKVSKPLPSGEQTPIIIHRFSPAGATSIIDPNQPISAQTLNGATTSNFELYVGGRQYSTFNVFRPNRRIVGQERLALAGVSTTFVPLVSFRLKSAFQSVSVKIEGFDIITAENLVYELRLDSTLTNASYVTPTNGSAAETACEADSSATAISGGELLYKGLIRSTGAGANAAGFGTIEGLGLDIPQTDAVTLCVRTLSGNSVVSGVLRWREEW